MCYRQFSRVALTVSVFRDKGQIVYDSQSDPLRANPDRPDRLIGIVE
jgi:hypothetical protein